MELVGKVIMAMHGGSVEHYQSLSEGQKGLYQAHAQAALSAIEDAGYVIVPKEPTEAMIAKVSNGTERWNIQMRKDYIAMIQASKGEG